MLAQTRLRSEMSALRILRVHMWTQVSNKTIYMHLYLWLYVLYNCTFQLFKLNFQQEAVNIFLYGGGGGAINTSSITDENCGQIVLNTVNI